MDQTPDAARLLRELHPPPPDAARALLERSGIDPLFLERWQTDGRVFVLADAGDDGEGPYPAAALVAAAGGKTMEIRAFAVAPEEDAAGERLVTELSRRLCREGHARMLAAVSSQDVALVALLQAAGFRPAHVERDAATPERGFRDAPSRDLLWLELVF